MRSERAAALAGFALLTLAVFRPTLSELAHTSPAFQGLVGDALLLMWATTHVSRALLAAPLHLFDAGIYHPARYTLAFGDHMIGQALVGLPIWLVTGNPLLEYNLLALASYALGATATFAYARDRVGSVAAATAAGLVFAFTPFRFHSPLWLQVLCTPFMPLALLFWLRFVRDLRWRDWALWVACWVAHSLMGMYLALYFALTMGVLAVGALVLAPARRAPRLVAGTLLGPAAALVLLAPTLWPYAYLRATQGHLRAAGLDTTLGFFLPGPGTLTGRLAGLEGFAQFGPGLVVWGLAALGLVAAWRHSRERPFDRFVWTAQVIGLGLTLTLILTPMRLQLRLPGLDMVRASNRAFFVSLLFLATFAAEGVRWLVACVPEAHRRLLAGALVLLVAADMGTPPRERKRIPFGDEIPPAYRWLRDQPGDEVVYEGVLGIEGPALAMYYAIFHRKRLVNGYSGFTSPGPAFVNQRLAKLPDPGALRLLGTLGVRHVLWHLPDAAASDAFAARLPRPSLEVAARFGGDLVLAVGPPPPAPAVAPVVRPLDRGRWRLDASTGADTLALLRDGDRRTAWQGEAVRGQPPPWLRVDLGGTVPVAGVRCVPLGAHAPGVYFAAVELSADGEHWQPAGARFEPDSLQMLFQRPADLAYYEARFPTRMAHYLRLIDPELAFWGGPWEIAELDVLGDCAAAPLPGCPGGGATE